MPDPLIVQVQSAIQAVVVPLSAPVPEARVYSRSVLEYSPDRDGCPAVIVAPTPGRIVTRRKTLSKIEIVYPFTVILSDGQGGSFKTDPVWRAGWADVVAAALHGTSLTDVSEVVRIAPDGQTILDLTAWEQAGIWRAAVSVLVTCRTGLSG